MSALINDRLTALTRLTLVSSNPESSASKIRLRVYIPPYYQQKPVISQLISDYGLVVNITGAMLGENTAGKGSFDLELRGTPQQIANGLAYLESLTIKIVGKPNAEGDSWHC
jgi:L-aspartate semialdehyde sulfurtransferase ferredoxin